MALVIGHAVRLDMETAVDPIALFRAWMTEAAEATEPNDAERGGAGHGNARRCAVACGWCC